MTWVHKNFALIIMVLGLSTIFIFQEVNDSNTDNKLSRAIFNECVRVQKVRRIQNINGYVLWLDRSDRGESLTSQRKRLYTHLSWTPLTDCDTALSNPLNRQAPHPIFFRRRLPPSTALGLKG